MAISLKKMNDEPSRLGLTVREINHGSLDESSRKFAQSEKVDGSVAQGPSGLAGARQPTWKKTIAKALRSAIKRMPPRWRWRSLARACPLSLRHIEETKMQQRKQPRRESREEKDRAG
ncbi:hypothetical protein ACSFA7_32370 [Variovorax sp. LT1R20]|uniref:hypothetical protein n=1 Tax=Variovorax sp. LT1R20 TaxID=3443729 RepID=UPI003F47BBEE